MPRLQILNGKRQGANFEIGRSGAVIGHRNTAPISIDDPWVSWDHARIFVQNDAYWVEDLGSTNGTFVNCVRVKRERLNHEDIVFFGKTHVIFLVPELSGASAGDAPSDEKKRSNFEVDLEAVAANAYAAPKAPAKNGRSPNQSAGPALPVRPEELAPLMPRLEPGEESSRSRRDPFRSGPDPWAEEGTRNPSALAKLSPESDPFASARSESKGGDPFSVGEDPFDGPRTRSIAETQHDRDDLPSGVRPTNEDQERPKKGKGGFEHFDIDENEDPGPVAPVSAAEVSSLLEANKKSSDGEDANLDDLDMLLGDAAARTPDPGLYKPPQQRKPSEALTRPIDTAEAARAIAEAARPPEPPAPGSSRFAAPPRPLELPRSGTGKFAPLPENKASGALTQPLAVPATTPKDEGRPLAVGDLAFEVAKLQDEVRRLRMALDAARQNDPEKVRVAVEGLRNEELGRQAREVAELRRELATLKAQHEKTQTELDDVTTDMIDKEDTIDALKKRVADLEGKKRAAAPAAEASGDELGALEF